MIEEWLNRVAEHLEDNLYDPEDSAIETFEDFQRAQEEAEELAVFILTWDAERLDAALYRLNTPALRLLIAKYHEIASVLREEMHAVLQVSEAMKMTREFEKSMRSISTDVGATPEQVEALAGVIIGPAPWRNPIGWWRHRRKMSRSLPPFATSARDSDE